MISRPTRLEFIEYQENITFEHNSVRHTAKGGWFKVIETDHEKRGLEFVIPLEHPSYSEKTVEILSTLEPGESVCMQVKSINERETAWRCYDIST